MPTREGKKTTKKGAIKFIFISCTPQDKAVYLFS